VNRVDQVNIACGWFIIKGPPLVVPQQYKMYERTESYFICTGAGDTDKICALIDRTLGFYGKEIDWCDPSEFIDELEEEEYEVRSRDKNTRWYKRKETIE